MQNTFLIGDTHIGHDNIIIYEAEKRPFANIEEHDEVLVERWNNVVSPKDIVWHLGDLLFGKTEANHAILNRLNGHKKLVMGNHDKFPNQYLIKEILPRFELVCGVGNLHGFVLTHIPIEQSTLGRWKGNIHGHTHSRKLEDPRYINVSCEQIGSTPISYDEILKKWAQHNKWHVE